MHPHARSGEQGTVAGTRHDDVFHRRQLAEQGCEQGQQGAVGDDHAVGGVLDDEHQLLRGEPEVEGVQDRAHGGDREVRLDMFGVVPHEGRDTVVVRDREVLAQRVRQLGRAGTDLGVGTALRFSLTRPGDHL